MKSFLATYFVLGILKVSRLMPVMRNDPETHLKIRKSRKKFKTLLGIRVDI